jgi:P27 family predicted phage terminase small subunit
MPSGMAPTAQAAWRVVLRELAGAEIVTGADMFVLRLFCEAYARYVEAAELYAAASPLIKDRGHLTKNPLHQVVRDGADQVRLLARELGLSPAARANLRMTVGSEAPDIDADIGPARLRLVGADG